MKRLLFPLLVFLGLACTTLVLRSYKSPFLGLPGSDRQEIAEEIMSRGEYHGPPDVDPAVSEMSYVRSTNGGRSLFKLDLNNRTESPFAHTNEVVRVGGYSADGKYLMFLDLSKDTTRVRIFDRTEDSLVPIQTRSVKGGVNMLNVDHACWLDTNAFAINNLKQDATSLITIVGNRQVTQQIEVQGTAITPISQTTAGILQGSNVWILNFKTKERNLLLPYTNEIISIETGHPKQGRLSSDLVWLNYSKEIDEFLFCAWDESNYRHLFRFKQVGSDCILKQLTFDDQHSYNGRWIQRGQGVAFIGNHANHLYLAVRPSKSEESTNLFQEGHVHGYCVSSDGEKIYAIASINSGPLGIWLYNIRERKLRYVGPEQPNFKFSRIISREQNSVQSFDNLTIPYYSLAPGNFDKSKKYPAIIAIPAAGLQFFQAWERYSQFFANIGIFHFAVNHRGGDGYGREYSEEPLEKAYEDVMAVYKMAVQNPNVDKKRVYLMAFSGGNSVLNDLIREYPDKWAGAIMVSGSAPEQNKAALQNLRMFLFTGGRDQTPGLNSGITEFTQWARTNGLAVTTMVDPPSGHKITDTEVDKTLAIAVADFIFGFAH